MIFSNTAYFIRSSNSRGFTLLVAIIFVSVILSVGLALTDIAYKQVILASTARQSQYAFYNADSAMECALEQDQVIDLFDYTSTSQGGTNAFMCEGQQISYSFPSEVGNIRTATFNIGCTGGDPVATVQIVKNENGTPTTHIYADGFNDCNASDPQRVERGLQSHY